MRSIIPICLVLALLLPFTGCESATGAPDSTTQGKNLRYLELGIQKGDIIEETSGGSYFVRLVVPDDIPGKPNATIYLVTLGESKQVVITRDLFEAESAMIKQISSISDTAVWTKAAQNMATRF